MCVFQTLKGTGARAHYGLSGIAHSRHYSDAVSAGTAAVVQIGDCIDWLTGAAAAVQAEPSQKSYSITMTSVHR